MADMTHFFGKEAVLEVSIKTHFIFISLDHVIHY